MIPVRGACWSDSSLEDALEFDACAGLLRTTTLAMNRGMKKFRAKTLNPKSLNPPDLWGFGSLCWSLLNCMQSKVLDDSSRIVTQSSGLQAAESQELILEPESPPKSSV